MRRLSNASRAWTLFEEESVMKSHGNEIHPYWFRNLATEYDARAKEIAQQIARRKREDAAVRAAAHQRIQADEFASMPNGEFDYRIRMAKAVYDLTTRWLDGGCNAIHVFGVTESQALG